MPPQCMLKRRRHRRNGNNNHLRDPDTIHTTEARLELRHVDRQATMAPEASTAEE